MAERVHSTRLVSVAIVGLVTLIAFESMAVATAMPVVAADLDAVRSYSLAFSLFFTASLLGMVLAGSWSDVNGPTVPLVAGMVLFAGGLVLCGVATSFFALLVGRLVSGGGAGALVVTMYVVVAAVYPERARPKVFGWVSAAWVLPAVIGPPIAGWLATDHSWRLVFLVVPPFALLALAMLVSQIRALPKPVPGAAAPKDRRVRALLGLGIAVGAALLQWAVQQVSSPSTTAVVLGLVGIVLIAGSLPRLVPVGTLRVARGLPSVIAVRGLFTAAFFGAETYIPLALHAEKGLSLTLAGLTLTSGALGWAAGSWVQGRPRMHSSRHVLLSTGAVLVALGVGGLSLSMLSNASPWVAAPVWALGAVGMGLALSSTSVLVLGLSAPDEQGRNSAALQISDALGSICGVGLAGAVFATLHTSAGSDRDVYTTIWLALAVVALGAALVGWRARPLHHPADERSPSSVERDESRSPVRP